MQTLAELAKERLYRNNRELTNSSNSIELPEEIDNLIDNKSYRNKFKKLIREGHLRDLIELAEVAKTKNMPSHFFAKWTRTSPERGLEGQPTNWQRTLEWLAKARKVAQDALQVVKRLNVQPDQLKTVYKACWSVCDAVNKAITAQEVGKGDKFKFFCWLCWRT